LAVLDMQLKVGGVFLVGEVRECPFIVHDTILIDEYERCATMTVSAFEYRHEAILLGINASSYEPSAGT
jgi:hypothetical protein